MFGKSTTSEVLELGAPVAVGELDELLTENRRLGAACGTLKPRSTEENSAGFGAGKVEFDRL